MQPSHRVWLDANGEGPWPCAWTCGELVHRLGGRSRDRDRGIVHHDDRDHGNNVLANLRAMHHRCHVELHRPPRLRLALHIDMRSPDVPSYRQLADQIAAAAVTAGPIPLPGFRTLQQETGLAMATVQHAIRVLVDEGLVYSVSGRGTFVSPK